MSPNENRQARKLPIRDLRGDVAHTPLRWKKEDGLFRGKHVTT
jgi:hypothetical protein